MSVVIQDESTRKVAMLPGKPVYYCGLDAFVESPASLIGQTVRSSSDVGITVSIDGCDVALDDLFIDRGWLQPLVLDDGAQAAPANGGVDGRAPARSFRSSCCTPTSIQTFSPTWR